MKYLNHKVQFEIVFRTSNIMVTNKLVYLALLVALCYADEAIINTGIKSENLECGQSSGTKYEKQDEFSQIALLGKGEKGDIDWIATGVPLTNEFILITPSSLYRPRPADAGYPLVDRVPVNWVQLAPETPEAQTNRIEKVIQHPDFSPQLEYNDIGLIKLETPIKFSGHITPGCLSPQKELPNVTYIEKAYNLDSRVKPPRLLKSELKLMSTADCKALFNTVPILERPEGIKGATEVCAEQFADKKKCGYRGVGPLIATDGPDGETRANIVGLGIHATVCGPVVYTRISPFISWIKKTINSS